MKTYKHLFDDMVKTEAIHQCFIDAAKRKRSRKDVQEVMRPEREEGNKKESPQCLPEHEKELRRILINEEFTPPKHKKVKINEYTCGKVREIIKPDFKYEQVVHHCIIRQLQPIVMHGLYEHALGSIPNKGTHSGKKTIEKWIRAYNGKKFYILKADVYHCFQTEDIERIEGELARIIKDDKFLRLNSKVLRSEAEWVYQECMEELQEALIEEDEARLQGLPLGFVTSQWYTQLNFKKFDHKMIEDWNEEYAIDHHHRYADDIVVFGRNKKKLHRLVKVMEEYMEKEMHQKLKANWQIFRFEYVDRKAKELVRGRKKTKGRALDYMGFVFHHDRTTIRKSILYRARKKAKRISKKEKATWYDACQFLSYLGYFDDTDTYKYFQDYIKPYVDIRKLKKIVSKHSRKESKKDDKLVQVRSNGKTTGD